MHILIIDDNERLCRKLQTSFYDRGAQTAFSPDSKGGISLFERNAFDIVLLDVRLGKANGLEILRKLNKIKPSVPIIVLTAYATIEDAVKAIKNGAYNYVQKPFKIDHLFKMMQTAAENASLLAENKLFKERVIGLTSKIITSNDVMLSLCERAKKLSRSDIPVLILGESGTGKELLADLIHATSDRSVHEIQKINCSAFPESLLDNELFGHEKGSYTGADSQFHGVFERANGSTLLLDEIGDMPLAIQTKILRTIQENKVRRIGGSKQTIINVRFISSTNKDIQTLIEQSRFREDLYFRINGARLTIPPLRERTEDIPLLAQYFLETFAREQNKANLRMTEEALDAMSRNNWPGNVRELRSAIQFAVTVCEEPEIRLDHLPILVGAKSSSANRENLWEQNEKNLILRVLNETNKNKKRASALLNISRPTLYSKMRKYGIL